MIPQKPHILLFVREIINMQFTKTRTYLNLARAFAGESQAGMRYQLTAQLAQQQGYKILADTIRTIAKNETNHAEIFFDHMIQKGGSVDSVKFDADYPYHAGDLLESLRLAALDESKETNDVYPAFAAIAQEEGFPDIADSFTKIAEIEAQHQTVFNYLYDGVKNGTLYKSDTPVLWVCSECGHMHVSCEAWDSCPVCKQAQGYVQLHLPTKKGEQDMKEETNKKNETKNVKTTEGGKCCGEKKSTSEKQSTKNCK